MDNWNQTPNCSGWMGFFCAPVIAAKERCRYIIHSVFEEGFLTKHCFLEQISVYI